MLLRSVHYLHATRLGAKVFELEASENALIMRHSMSESTKNMHYITTYCMINFSFYNKVWLGGSMWLHGQWRHP